jgi:hypothetical protein
MADTGIASVTNYKPGMRVFHPVYGHGTVIAVENTIKMGDHNNWDKAYQSSIIRSTNGLSRYNGHLNIAVKFDDGGPQGFALDASNEAGNLFEVT